MAYLEPYFDPDVFVSYSHGDPRHGSPLKNWTHALVDKLNDELLSLDTEFDNFTSGWVGRSIPRPNSQKYFAAKSAHPEC